MSSRHIYPPTADDQRCIDIIAAGGGVSVANSDINYAFREALALLMGYTAAWAVDKQIDDVWDLYKIFAGITDTSEPLDYDVILPTFLTEDGASYLTKQDSAVLMQEF